MRLIDGDALRDRLQSLGYDDWNQGVTTTWAEAFSECANMVDEQPTIEPEPHWIPCSERLPKETGKYLITEEDGEVCVDTYLVKHNEWYECFPIAWMPLPEAFREGEG